MSHHPLCEQFRVHPSEIESRRRFLRWSDSDERNLPVIHRAIEANIDAIVAAFYTHLRGFGELERFFSDEAGVRRLAATLRDHLLSLAAGAPDMSYFERRLGIGGGHEKLGIAQKWFIGGYAVLFDLIVPGVIAAAGPEGDPAAALATLHKVIALESILGAETYSRATRQRLEGILQTLAEAQQELRDAARLDSLTQISNRKHLMEGLEAEFQRSRRFEQPFTLLFVDLDHFKRINDAHGHPYGDFVLRRTVDLMSGVLRPADLIGRFGGEEFIIGLVMTGPEDAVKIAERLRETIEQAAFEQKGTPVRVTVSLGLASIAGRVPHLASLIDAADKAMYRAKQSGRNRIVAATP